MEIDKNSEIACIAVILDGVKRNPSELLTDPIRHIAGDLSASDFSSSKNTSIAQVIYHCIFFTKYLINIHFYNLNKQKIRKRK